MATALSHKLPYLPEGSSEAAGHGELRFHLLLLLAALALGFSLQSYGPDWSRTIFEQGRLGSFGGIAALLLGVLASMLAHELGHLFAALFLNYEFLGAAIGPLRIDRWRARIICRLEEAHWLRCSISAVPRQVHNVWRGRMMMVVAAGPMVSLLFLLAAAGAAALGHAAKTPESWLTTFWSSCAEVNFFLFVLGLVPNSRSAAARNDAALFLSLWKNDADAVDMFMSHQAADLTFRGMRPQDFPEPLLLELTNFRGRPYTSLIVARRMVEWAADSGNIVLASEWDQAALAAGANCSRRLANAALAESAFFDVLFREDMRSAVSKFTKVDFDELFPPALSERAWAARLIACGLPHRALTHILRAQGFLPPGNPYYQYESALLERLRGRALAQSRPGRLLC